MEQCCGHSSKYEEWHHHHHQHHSKRGSNKYKQAGWMLNVHLEYETNCIYNDPPYDDEELLIAIKATLVLNNNEHNNRYDMESGTYYRYNYNAHEQETDSDDTDDSDDTEIDCESEIESEIESDANNAVVPPTLSSSFDAIECEYHCSSCTRTRGLRLPSPLLAHLTSLYECSARNDVSGLLQSARFWHNDDYGQCVVIGAYLNEIVDSFQTTLSEVPTDCILIVSEYVGDAILWLRQPGVNVFKWSATTSIGIRKSSVETGLHKRNNQLVCDDQFYFSGYTGDYRIQDMLLLHDATTGEYLDLDWCFVVFLSLGLIPTHENAYYRWYFHQKLLSALPPTHPLKLLSNASVI